MIHIMVVEDNTADFVLFRESLKDNPNVNSLRRMKNGFEAVEYFHQNPEYLFPNLIFLDLNMPGKSGFDVLQELKQNPKTLHIPVLILTTSDDKNDIEKSYQMMANSYIVKEADFEQFQNKLWNALDYWVKTVHLFKR